MLAGPAVDTVGDDPEDRVIWEETVALWQSLAPEDRSRTHLVAVPMDDPVENALVINALQRHAAVVVQKSLAEGFGLTVAEAMWKRRPMVASAVGGIVDQITNEESGTASPAIPRILEIFRRPRRAPARFAGGGRALRRECTRPRVGAFPARPPAHAVRLAP